MLIYAPLGKWLLLLSGGCKMPYNGQQYETCGI